MDYYNTEIILFRVVQINFIGGEGKAFWKVLNVSQTSLDKYL
jgi:hypothetical protein